MSNPTDTRAVEAYLFFNGKCEEAIGFYQKAIGAEVEFMMRYKESPEPMPPEMLPPGFADKIMHATLRIGQTKIMASDGCEKGEMAFKGFSLAITVPTEAEADKVFAALQDGGQVTMPLEKTFWSPRFGMLQDRYGVGWMVMVPGPAPQ